MEQENLKKKPDDVGTLGMIMGFIVLIVLIFIVIKVLMFIWGAISNSVSNDSTNEVVVEEVQEVQEVQIEQPVVEPVIEIATLYNVPMSKLSEQFDTQLNKVGNLVFENNDYKLLVESKDGVKSIYAEVQIKSLGSCTKAGVSENSDKALELVGLDQALKGRPTNPPAGVANGAIEYCEYPNTSFVPGVTCAYDGGYYDVSLSPRTYCSN